LIIIHIIENMRKVLLCGGRAFPTERKTIHALEAVLPEGGKTTEPITENIFLRRPIPAEGAFPRRGRRGALPIPAYSSGPGILSREGSGALGSPPPPRRLNSHGGTDVMRGAQWTLSRCVGGRTTHDKY
jgi:hypothetical protein